MNYLSRVAWILQSPRSKWSCFSGQLYGLVKMYLVYVHATFRVCCSMQYAMMGACLSSAVWGHFELWNPIKLSMNRFAWNPSVITYR